MDTMSDVVSIMADQLISAAYEKKEKDKSGKDKSDKEKKE